jgi:hypothetical protein
MANATTEIMTDYSGPIPAHATYSMAAGYKALKGTIACQDANGRAAPPIAPGTAGIPAAGVVEAATVDNTSGANDALSVELALGVHTFAYVQTAPKPQAKMYVVDNQTVSATISDGTANRGFAGICTEVDTVNSVCKVFISPLNGGLS